MDSRERLTKMEKAKIIEQYVGGNKSMKQVADLFDVSVQTVSNSVSLYFEKPKVNKLLFSKV